MTAENIARVVQDIRAGNVKTPEPFDRQEFGALRHGPVIDATGVYRSHMRTQAEIAIYEDHPSIAPPWDIFTVAYENEHGNVHAMCCVDLAPLDLEDGATPLRWESANDIDWERVRWKLHAFVFTGGRGGGRPIPTTGPLHEFLYAIYDDGTPADLHWQQLDERFPLGTWDNANLVLVGCLNFLNCRNIDIVEPKRSRGEQRRINRTGVTVSELTVYQAGKSVRAAERGATVGGVPLTTVRGHFAEYGPAYGKGLLFGKFAGRYWIPAFARGTAELGERVNDYKIAGE